MADKLCEIFATFIGQKFGRPQPDKSRVSARRVVIIIDLHPFLSQMAFDAYSLIR